MDRESTDYVRTIMDVNSSKHEQMSRFGSVSRFCGGQGSYKALRIACWREAKYTGGAE